MCLKCQRHFTHHETQDIQIKQLMLEIDDSVLRPFPSGSRERINNAFPFRPVNEAKQTAVSLDSWR